MTDEIPHVFVPGARGATLLALHAAGGDENEFIPICRAVGSGAAVLSPRLSPEIGPNEIAHWLDAAAARHGFDRTSVYAFGYADSAALAASVLFHHPHALAGAILLRPDAAPSPASLPDLKGTRVLIAAGRDDAEHSRALAQLLAQAGAAADFAVMDSGRDLIPQDFAMAKKWFGQV